MSDMTMINKLLRMYPFKFKKIELVLQISVYENKNLALLLYIPEDLKIGGASPYMKASINIPEKLPENYVIIKNYSENKGILECLIEHDFVRLIEEFQLSQFVKGYLCEFIFG